jgi:hypothetical protein
MTNLQKALEEFATENNITIREYSGRGMYGKTCLSIYTDADFDLVELGMYLGKYGGVSYQEIAGMRSDQMGKGMIYYWPHVTYKGTQG